MPEEAKKATKAKAKAKAARALPKKLGLLPLNPEPGRETDPRIDPTANHGPKYGFVKPLTESWRPSADTCKAKGINPRDAHVRELQPPLAPPELVFNNRTGQFDPKPREIDRDLPAYKAWAKALADKGFKRVK